MFYYVTMGNRSIWNLIQNSLRRGGREGRTERPEDPRKVKRKKSAGEGDWGEPNWISYAVCHRILAASPSTNCAR